MKNQKVQNYLVHHVTDFFSKKLDAEFRVQSINYTFFNKVILNDVYIEDQEADSLLHSKQISANLQYLSLKDRELYFNNVKLDRARIRLHNDTSKKINIKFLIDALKRKDTTKPRMHLKFADIQIKNSHLKYTTNKPASPSSDIDFNRISLNNFNISVDQLEADSGWANFTINELSFIDKSGFKVSQMKSNVYMDTQNAIIKKLKLQTPQSFLTAKSINFRHNGFKNFKNFINKVAFDMDINSSDLSFHDLAYFTDAFKGLPNTNVALEGKLEGKVKNLRGKNLFLAVGEETKLKTDFSADGLPDIHNTFLYIDIEDLTTGIEDIDLLNKLINPQKTPISVPTEFDSLGLISYTGNFTGFIEDFVAYGTLDTDLGQISTDISIKPKQKQELKIDGNLKTNNFDVGGLINNEELLGTLSMDIQIKGNTRKNQGFQTYTNGTIKKLELNNYNYKNIKLDGLLTDKKYDGNLTIEDPNINLNFSGGIDFSDKVPEFDFQANLKKAKLNKLNFVENDTTANLSVDLTSNFKGNNLDNAQGIIQLKKGYLVRNGKELNFDNLKIDAYHENNNHQIYLKSDYIDGSLIGKYRSTSVHQSLKNLFYSYLPSFIKNENDTSSVEIKNNFELKVNLKNTHKITQIFNPQFNISENSKINLDYNGSEKAFSLNVDADEFRYKYYHFKNLNINSQSQDTVFSLIMNFDHIKFNPKEETTYLNNYSLKSLTGDNKSKILIDWNDPDRNSSKGEFVALVNFNKPEMKDNIVTKIFFLPGHLKLQNERWDFTKSSITIDTTSLTFNMLRFQHNNQEMSINGKITKNPEDTLELNFSEIDLNYANVLFPSQKVHLGGIINGEANLADLYGKPTFKSNLQIDTLFFNQQKLGHTEIFSEWNPNKKNIWMDIESNRGDLKTIDIEGDYEPNSQTIDFNLALDKLRLDFLNPIMEKSFSNVKGLVSGHLNLVGTTEHPVFNGKLIAQKSEFTIDYLQSRYNFTKIINVSDNKLIFDNTVVYDKYGNKSNVDGTLHFQDLKNIIYDFKINANEFLALNTSGENNSTYYGDGYVTGLLDIRGNNNDKILQIDASVNSEENTMINLPIGASDETKKTKFITFKGGDTIQTQETFEEYTTDLSGIDLNLDLEVTPVAETRLIFDPALGDMIKARGRGNLDMKVDQNGEFRIFGDYIIEEGDYMFSLKNVINKKFRIEQGSQIIWNGKPQDADIDITATYNLRTSLNNLLMDTSDFYTKRIPVECKILLTEKLNNPNINFEIALPTADESTKARVQAAISTDEELNKQFLSLLVLNTFMPAQQYLAGQPDAFDMGATSMAFTTSELLSNQLSHWLSQISNNWDVGINYQPGDNISRDQVEVALSTQLLNDRLIINGNVGTGGKYAQTSEVVGDFRVDWKLSKNGKLRLKFFNRNSDKLIYEETRYIQGAGLYYREEFNNFNELINKMGSIRFKKKDKKETNN